MQHNVALRWRDAMYSHFNDGLDYGGVKTLGIKKEKIVSLFLNPRTRQPCAPKKLNFSMRWCTHVVMQDNFWDHW